MKPLHVASYQRDFRAEAARHGFTETHLADTASGPVLGFTGPGSGPPRYLSAGIHGDEPAGPLAALELLKAGMFDRGAAWVLCPALNPTGLTTGTRENEAGVDLNRDYLVREAPEAKAHAEWLESHPCPELFISLHEDWESSGYYFYEINQGPDVPERARAILRSVEAWFPPEPAALIDEHEPREPGWIYHRADADLPDLWPEAIFLAKRGCPLSFTMESPSSAALDDRVAAHVAAVQALTGTLG